MSYYLLFVILWPFYVIRFFAPDELFEWHESFNEKKFNYQEQATAYQACTIFNKRVDFNIINEATLSKVEQYYKENLIGLEFNKNGAKFIFSSYANGELSQEEYNYLILLLFTNWGGQD